MQTEVFSVQSAAKIFFHGLISPWTLRSWIRLGKLPAYKIGGRGGRVIIKRSDLEALVRLRPVNSGQKSQ